MTKTGKIVMKSFRGPHERVRTPVGTRSRTKQAFKDECDINLIIKRQQEGVPGTHFNAKEPKFGDFSEGTDLKSAIDGVQQAREDFAKLPASVRAAAGNKPEQMLAMMEDEKGQLMLQEAGLELGLAADLETLKTAHIEDQRAQLSKDLQELEVPKKVDKA